MHVSFIKFPEDVEAQKEWISKEARRRLLENNFVGPMCVDEFKSISTPKKNYEELIKIVNNVINNTYFHGGEVR